MIGTSGHGHTYPGATVPFGMVQLSPDTRIDGSWDGCSGYHYSDNVIYGFSHTHLNGTGVSDYGDILLMPTMGEPSFDSQVYRSTLSHTNEKATPGYYQVRLLDDNINAEMTATERVGFHKYTFPKSDKSHVLLDLVHHIKGGGSGVKQAYIQIKDTQTVTGYRVTSSVWAANRQLYFAIKFSKPFISNELYVINF